MLADPHSIAYYDRTNIFRPGRFASPPRYWIRVMAVGVHDRNVAGKDTVAANRDQLPYGEKTIMADSGIVPDLQRGMIGEASRK